MITALSRRSLIAIAGIGTAAALTAEGAQAADACDCDLRSPPTKNAPKYSVKGTGFPLAPITNSLAHAVAFAPDNAKMSVLFDNFMLALPANASDARVFHGVYNFALSKGQATGFKAFVRGAELLSAGAQSQLYVTVGRAGEGLQPARQETRRQRVFAGVKRSMPRTHVEWEAPGVPHTLWRRKRGQCRRLDGDRQHRRGARREVNRCARLSDRSAFEQSHWLSV